MWEPHRQCLIKEHLFYLEQARKRLLSQFNEEDNRKEADMASKEWLEQHSNYPEDISEIAYDLRSDLYHLLSDMRDRTRLSIVAGIYHEWDKQLRDWMINNIQHWHSSDKMYKKIWAATIKDLTELLECLGWMANSIDYMEKINACRLVVNVYKHGEGNSLTELQNKYPEYLIDPLSHIIESVTFGDLDYLNHTHLSVTDDQLQEFSDAIVAFWKDVPENIVDRDAISLPDWFVNTAKSK
jgi:hypothetical protein